MNARWRVRRLLDVLPVVLRVPAGGTGDAVVDHLAAEVAMDVPGQQVVLDRLLDWLLVCTLREWLDRPGSEPPAWWAAQRDPVAGDALRLLHAEPGAPWTVSRLADLLAEQRSATIADVTRTVGYNDPFGFSAAFKRIRGVNPSAYRRTVEARARG